MIIVFLSVMVASCALNSLFMWLGWMQTLPPYNIKTGISECQGGNSGTLRQDGVIPEIQYTDGARNFFYAKQVRDSRPEDMIELPMGSTF